MRLTTHRAHLAARFGVMLVLGLCGHLFGAATAAAADGPQPSLRVGHAIQSIDVPGSAQGEPRAVDVDLWYPADPRAFERAPKTIYRSALWDRPLPAPWTPLQWEIEAEVAREAAIDPHGRPFPVIVFSHGSENNPIDYADTLELIAGAGFVVAAPSHVNNTQDDVRMDFINAQVDPPWFTCSDARPGPCSRPNIPFSMTDRVRDVSAVLDELPGWLGDRVDTARAGVLGHSRGTATALAAAGGSAPWSAAARCQAGTPPPELCWPSLETEPDLKAIMGLAIAAQPVTGGVNLANVKVPALLVAGKLDQASPHAVSESAYEAITSTEKAFVSIDEATHRHFDSTYCDQTQAAGAFAQADPDAVLDLHTFRLTVKPTTSGQAIQYCPFSTFTSPTDIRPLVASEIGFDVAADSVPTTGLDTDEVKLGVAKLAAAFFGTVLERAGNQRPHFARYLAPRWLERHVPMVGEARVSSSSCPPGLCEDR
jgi:predicted dienelactone hydrolase